MEPKRIWKTSSGNDLHASLSHPNTIVTTNPSTYIKSSIHLVTRSQNNIFKPKSIFQVTKYLLPENVEPSNNREAKKHEHYWRKAFTDEFDTLLRNGTWSLVLPPKHINIVCCKWLFLIKRNADGTINRYKARLGAKVFTQCPGVDFH
jgi:hypothetical protein